MSDTHKRFEEYPKIDCNNCTHYWNDACDGATMPLTGSTRLCTAFKASRNVNIPLQIEALRKDVRRLRWSVLFVAIGMVVYIISNSVLR